jgi:F-type H+-transporting ATPase subunit epsilon
VALPTHLDLQIVTPDRLVVRERVDEVQIPGAQGYFGVLPGHTPCLRAGRRQTVPEGRQEDLRVAPYGAECWGTGDGPRQLAERADEIDVARAGGSQARGSRRAEVRHRLRARASPEKALAASRFRPAS